MKQTLLMLTLLLSIGTSYTTLADDSGDSYSSPSALTGKQLDARLEKARAHLGKQKYKKAIKVLNKVVRADVDNADAWNLLGYSHRKLGKYKQAGKAYRMALNYNPEHKGALEYQGELFISLKKFDDARANRERLAALCPDGCQELEKLDKALAAIN
jgi:tetratricopeptide (TPR) repeat protein